MNTNTTTIDKFHDDDSLAFDYTEADVSGPIDYDEHAGNTDDDDAPFVRNLIVWP